jgi:hypothetical protein
MALNRDSTHPNPWRPPNDMQKLMHIYYPDNIYKGYRKEFKPTSNWFNDNSLSWKLYIGFKKGFVIGATLSAIEIYTYQKDKTPRAMLGRVLYTTIPMTSFFMSYVATLELSKSVFEKNGLDKNSNWTYALATLAPATIWSTWKTVRGGCHVVFFGSIFGGLYNELKQMGYDVFNSDPWRLGQNEVNSMNPADGWKWKGFSHYDKYDDGPQWKKWEEQKK